MINNRVVRFLKKFKIVKLSWRLFLKFFQFKYFPIYLEELGFFQYLNFIWQVKFVKKKKLLELNVKDYKFPIYLRVGTSDEEVFKQIFIQKEYRFNYSKDFKPKFIVDAGANCGYSTIYFANLFPKTKIIAIEPETSNFDILTKNTCKFKNVELVKGGIWYKNAPLKIVNLSVNRHWSFRVDEVLKKDADFKGYGIFYIMKKFGFDFIDILKIDVEGSEKIIFEKNYTKWLSNSNLIFLEIHERYAPGVTKVIENRVKDFKFETSVSGENLVLRK